MTALAEESKIDLGMGVPNLVTSERLDDIVQTVIGKKSEAEDKAIIFESALTITEYKVKTSLYLLFNERLVELTTK
jgi:chemotaxis protein CheY-P-specific phosphatase CheC